MKLKRLIVHGFKSFKDKTVIHFEEGITGIVGPNGCGKSNIVDALFWVMGEQSAKHLRGSSMKDVIFSGSSKYPPAAWAEVSLVLGNEQGKHIHLGDKVINPQEIQLTRKLYRNGESEYRINNVPARLKDIQEVFMDTGAGAKSYSVIAQGEINRLVQARPQERKIMIEEVAGITKFKLRKKESEKKIDLAQANLARLGDLKAEVHKQLSQLQAQADKAAKARVLKQKIEESELVLQAQKEYQLLKDHQRLNKVYQEELEESDALASRKNVLELGAEGEKNKRLEMSQLLEGLQGEYNELSRRLATHEERLTFLKKNKEEKMQLTSSRKAENEELAAEYGSRKKRLEELKDERENLSSIESDEQELLELEEKVEVLKERLEEQKDSISEVSEQLRVAQEKVRQKENLFLKNNSKMEDVVKNIQEVTIEVEKLEGDFAHVTLELNARKLKVEENQKHYDELVVQAEGTKEEAKGLGEEFKTLEDLHLKKVKESIQVESRLSSLAEIRFFDGEGFEGNLEFMKNHQGAGVDLLGDLIECEEEYSLGLQNLFKDYLQSIVGASGSQDELYEWHAKHAALDMEILGPQGAELFMTDKQVKATQERLEQLGLGRVVHCLDIVRINKEEHRQKIEGIFKGHFLVDQLDLALISALGQEVPFAGLASKDGKRTLHRRNGATVMRLLGQDQKDQKSLGPILRNNELARLKTLQEGLKEEMDQLFQAKNGKKELWDKRHKEGEELTKKCYEKKSELSRHQSLVESKEAFSQDYHKRLEDLKAKKADLSKVRLTLLENEETLAAQLNEEKEAAEEKVSVLEARQEELENLRPLFEEEKQNLLKKEMEKKSREKLGEGLDSQILDLEGQIKKLAARQENNKTLIIAYEEEVVKTAMEVQELQISNAELAKGLGQRDAALRQKKDELGKLERVLETKEKEVQGINGRLLALDREMTLKKLKMDQIVVDEDLCVRNVLEKSLINLREALAGPLELGTYLLQGFSDLNPLLEEMRTQGKVLRDREFSFVKKSEREVQELNARVRKLKAEFSDLGEINWGADGEFQRQKTRFDFLGGQEEELKKSILDLNTAISHIDEKSKTKFDEAYHEVNQFFEKVFPILFGGGNATLQLLGDIGDPECGVEIVARPPGKKMQNINLMSGGEKAMTAVALIFSIFLVKPSPFCLLDEVDAPLDDANIGRFNTLLKEMGQKTQFILITHNKKTMELNDVLYGITMQDPGVSKAVSIQLH